VHYRIWSNGARSGYDEHLRNSSQIGYGQMFDCQPTLSGQLLRLRPMVAADHDGLYRAAADPLIWAQHPDPSRAQRMMLDHAFRFVPAVTFRIGENNLRSRRAVEKLGAIYEGVEPQPEWGQIHVIYRLSRTVWQRRAGSASLPDAQPHV
jgi:hypothetical protein